MRCAIDFDENKELLNQNVNGWGEFQSLVEEPSYREEEIKSVENKEFFRGYKMALADVSRNLEILVDDEVISQEASDEMQAYLSGDLWELLISILDNEVE